MTSVYHQSLDRRPQRVLVVDDNDQVRRFTALMLKTEGFETAQANSGSEAIRLFEAEPPDCVVTDIYMPGEDGVALIGKIRHLAPGVPIIAVSGAVEAQSFLNNAGSLGADEILAKPFSADELTATIRRLLGVLG
jgi:CheY-like chemotaxis protein